MEKASGETKKINQRVEEEVARCDRVCFSSTVRHLPTVLLYKSSNEQNISGGNRERRIERATASISFTGGKISRARRCLTRGNDD